MLICPVFQVAAEFGIFLVSISLVHDLGHHRLILPESMTLIEIYKKCFYKFRSKLH